MSVTARNQPRQPKGVPTGGQWRPTGRPEAPVHLDEGPDDGERPAPRPIGAQARRYSAPSGGGLGALADEGTRVRGQKGMRVADLRPFVRLATGQEVFGQGLPWKG
jgi:hypothetical protein